jgi:hypothetical protein
MRKNRIAALLALAAALAAGAAAAATVTVLVRETKIRRRPQFYAPAAATARLGQSFAATGPRGGWYKTAQGYLHESAVTAKRVSLSAGGEASGDASADEITLAGKGFNEQVEKSYSSKHPGADFAAVDAMQRRSVSDGALRRFLETGGLIPEGEK